MADCTCKQIPSFYASAISENKMVSLCVELKSKLCNATEPMDTEVTELNAPAGAVMLDKQELLNRLDSKFQEIKTVCLVEAIEQCHTDALLSCLDLAAEPTLVEMVREPSPDSVELNQIIQ